MKWRLFDRSRMIVTARHVMLQVMDSDRSGALSADEFAAAIKKLVC